MLSLKNNSLTKTFASGVAAIATLAGVGLVSAPVHAVTTTLGGFCAPTTSVTVGDKTFTCQDTNLNTLSNPNDLIEIDRDVAGNFDLTYEFLNDYQGANGAFLRYTVAINDPNATFLGVGLDSTVSNFGPIEQVTKLVQWAGGSTLLTSTSGVPADFLFPAGLQFITVTDTINPNGGSVASFQTAAFRMRKKLKSIKM
jgi:hypothetical protein